VSEARVRALREAITSLYIWIPRGERLRGLTQSKR
jgi:hypothetical protein